MIGIYSHGSQSVDQVSYEQQKSLTVKRLEIVWLKSLGFIQATC